MWARYIDLAILHKKRGLHGRVIVKSRSGHGHYLCVTLVMKTTICCSTVYVLKVGVAGCKLATTPYPLSPHLHIYKSAPYTIEIESKVSMHLRDLKTWGCSVPSKARALLRDWGSLKDHTDHWIRSLIGLEYSQATITMTWLTVTKQTVLKTSTISVSLGLLTTFFETNSSSVNSPFEWAVKSWLGRAWASPTLTGRLCI